MATAAISLPDSLNRLEQAVLDNLRERFQEWSQCRLELVQWEKRHLCDEQPDPEKLAEHKKAIERLIFLGQIFSFAISHPEFPDAALVENVRIEQWILRELFLTYHNPNPMSE